MKLFLHVRYRYLYKASLKFWNVLLFFKVYGFQCIHTLTSDALTVYIPVSGIKTLSNGAINDRKTFVTFISNFFANLPLVPKNFAIFRNCHIYTFYKTNTDLLYIHEATTQNNFHAQRESTFRGVRAKKLFFIYIHLDFFRFHPSICICIVYVLVRLNKKL